FEWGTNMQHALLLARKQLARQSGTKQIIMVTDGEPTAHIEGGEAYFHYPPSPVTIEETLKEVMRCTRDGVRINTFMLDESYYLRGFVERMMKLNGGRAFFTNADTLGNYELVYFLEQPRVSPRASLDRKGRCTTCRPCQRGSATLEQRISRRSRARNVRAPRGRSTR